jgi:hypothetical protein
MIANRTFLTLMKHKKAGVFAIYIVFIVYVYIFPKGIYIRIEYIYVLNIYTY